MNLDKIFEALSSTVRRKILAYLSATEMTAGEIADRFDISKPSVSKHLSILENAGLIASERHGQFIHYRLVQDNLVNTLNGYVQEVCPVSKPLKKESKTKAEQQGAKSRRVPKS
jgi:ArsR family transcriptional regulator